MLLHPAYALILILCCVGSLGYKILVFSPTLTRSHMILNGKVADTLAADGHDVTVLEIEFFVNSKAIESTKLAKRWIIDGPFVEKNLHEKQNIGARSFQMVNMLQKIMAIGFFQKFLNKACQNFLNEPGIIEKLKAEKFDVFIGYQLNLCGSALSRAVDIPIHILLVSCPIQEHVSSILGLPFQTSYVPTLFHSDFSDKMTYWERMNNFLLATGAQYSFMVATSGVTRMFREKFGGDFPDAIDIVKDSPFILVNVDEFVDFPRTTFHHVVYIGGLGLPDTTAKEIQEPYRSELEKGKSGVVFFSLGSAVDTKFLDDSFMQNVFAAFAALPDYHFIVKFDKHDNNSLLQSKTLSNVFPTSWAPQTDILAHPRVKLFISHCGYNSLLESARSGMPVLCVGFFADQMRNGRVAERNGWGLTFDKLKLLKGHTEFLARIQELLSNATYSVQAKRTEKLVKSKPTSAEERLTKSFRFLELNGGRLPELLPEGRNLSSIAYYNFDVILGLIMIATLIIVLLVALLRLCARAICLWKVYFVVGKQFWKLKSKVEGEKEEHLKSN
ncbi:UDP-glucoronosyl and UDP-glucosyl transferase domain-containing protein [Ditylenchus destructor]|uniref:glucuronosyltransferase n=1 Tax=Ditylenchus destructor TaxID=166010 RepID=A0AAD4N347_9BILA|nr:UDP-glucoronosyl and UDP-glucosyl transferase domain-containing protein [Ditylenchus destructor]